MAPKHHYDIAVIGGGAAGLMAAIAAARAGKAQGRTRAIVILESQERIGKKLLATGNGRCNLSNSGAKAEDYYGDRAFIRRVLAAFDPRATVAFFQELGLLCREEREGRIYPRSNQAASLLEVLRLELALLGIELITDCPITTLERQKGGWKIFGKGQQLGARRIVLAAGGQAAPALGGSRQGLELGQKLGHGLRPIFPALAPMRIERPAIRGLQGLRAGVKISLLADGQCLKTEEGELQFTQYGLSGICVFNLSRLAGEFFQSGSIEGQPYAGLSLEVDFLPEYSLADILALLKKLRKNRGTLPLSSFLSGFFPKRIHEFLVKAAYGGSLGDACSRLDDQTLHILAKDIKAKEFIPSAVLPWSHAQICAGGILSKEVAGETLESRKAPGVFLAGEILDIDGPCGGYNLQWAWSSGYLAGISAAASLEQEEKKG